MESHPTRAICIYARTITRVYSGIQGWRTGWQSLTERKIKEIEKEIVEMTKNIYILNIQQKDIQLIINVY